MSMDQILQHPILQTVLIWCGLGLLIGVVAKLVIPGSEQMGWIRTIFVGLIGSFLGNYVAPRLFQWPTYNPLSLQGIAMGILGAVILVLLNRVVTKS